MKCSLKLSVGQAAAQPIKKRRIPGTNPDAVLIQIKQEVESLPKQNKAETHITRVIEFAMLVNGPKDA